MVIVTKRSLLRKSVTQRNAIKRQRRVALYGGFSGETTNVHKQVADILGNKKLVLLTGGRLGPVKDVVEQATLKGAKNISVIMEPWTKFNPNISGKARNLIVKENQKTGSREFHERLSVLQTSKVKAYLFLPIEAKQFSGTMLELHSIVHTFSLEGMTDKIQRRPIFLVGEMWKPVFEQLKKDYAKNWSTIGRYVRFVPEAQKLEKLL